MVIKDTSPVDIFAKYFAGDWAGNSYATSGCPGTCDDRLMDPANFVVCETVLFYYYMILLTLDLKNASWSINSLKVYRKQMINGRITNFSTSLCIETLRMWVSSVVMATILILL